MKVEITREPEFSTLACIKLIAENTKEEIILGEMFEVENENSEVNWFYDNDSELGYKDITIFKKK